MEQEMETQLGEENSTQVHKWTGGYSQLAKTYRLIMRLLGLLLFPKNNKKPTAVSVVGLTMACLNFFFPLNQVIRS